MKRLTNDNLKNRLKNVNGSVWALILMIVLASLISPRFLQTSNIINNIRSISISGVLAMGMTFVILTGGIDLSVGAVVSFVSVVSAKLICMNVPIPLVMVIGVLAGALLGLLNGIGVVKGRIVPFIMTMGSMTAIQGLTLMISHGAPVSILAYSEKFNWFAAGKLWGIPVPVFIFGILIVILAFILKYTTFGRCIYAVGDNKEAARLAGIKVQTVEMMVYVICGMLSGFAALIYTSRLLSGDPTSGNGMELDAIAMVIIGGTSSLGGQGGVWGTLIGAGIIVVLNNVLNLQGVSPFLQQILQGLIIVAAVLIDRIRTRDRG